MDLINTIERIERKIGRITRRYEQTKKENDALLQENNALKNKLKERDEAVRFLEEELNKNRQKQGGNGLTEQNEAVDSLKKKIDQYINTINECIEWLSKN